MWRRLWGAPVASWWHATQTPVDVIARYVTIALASPTHAALGRLESELALTPAAQLRARLLVDDHPTPTAPRRSRFAHLEDDEDA
jgi:hypothetical protein